MKFGTDIENDKSKKVLILRGERQREQSCWKSVKRNSSALH